MSPIAPGLAPERDWSLKTGRPRSSGGTTYYTVPGVMFGSAGQLLTLLANTDYYATFFVSTPIVVDQLAFEVTSLAAGSNARIGLYPSDDDFQPAANAAPITDSGDISVASTGLKTFTPGTPIFLHRGTYQTVLNSNGAPVVRAYSMSQTIDLTAGDLKVVRPHVARTYAAFPTPGTRWTAIASVANAGNYPVWLRISAP